MEGQLQLRNPAKVMRLERLGSMHQSRLSFCRGLLRRLVAENWHIRKSAWNINSKGVGYAIYTVYSQHETYSLVAFSHAITDDMRTDRVIANAWDATFALVHNQPTHEDIERLQKHVPLQEAGRFTSHEISISRANRSVRLWNHVLEQLAHGEQPDCHEMTKVGYLMRTTAVYGSGKFGCADRKNFDGNTLFCTSFYPEMLTVYLIRSFSVDLIEYLASIQGGKSATTLCVEIKKHLGVGNSTGLGMAPFLVNHPGLLHSWIHAREEALEAVLRVQQLDPEKLALLQMLVRCSIEKVAAWFTEHPLQIRKLSELKSDLLSLQQRLDCIQASEVIDLIDVYNWTTQHLHVEGQELVISLLLELYPERVDVYANSMFADENALFPICNTYTVYDLRNIMESNFSWITSYDFSTEKDCHFFWYISEDKLEPRLGRRFKEDGETLELPIHTAKIFQELMHDLRGQPDKKTLAQFLLDFPEHRHAARRVCINAQKPYSEIQDNLIAENMMPLDLLRCKLSFLGADKFDPRSDKWLRIALFQGAPYPQELHANYNDLWIYTNDHNSRFSWRN